MALQLKPQVGEKIRIYNDNDKREKKTKKKRKRNKNNKAFIVAIHFVSFLVVICPKLVKWMK